MQHRTQYVESLYRELEMAKTLGKSSERLDAIVAELHRNGETTPTPKRTAVKSTVKREKRG